MREGKINERPSATLPCVGCLSARIPDSFLFSFSFVYLSWSIVGKQAVRSAVTVDRDETEAVPFSQVTCNVLLFLV